MSIPKFGRLTDAISGIGSDWRPRGATARVETVEYPALSAQSITLRYCFCCREIQYRSGVIDHPSVGPPSRFAADSWEPAGSRCARRDGDTCYPRFSSLQHRGSKLRFTTVDSDFDTKTWNSGRCRTSLSGDKTTYLSVSEITNRRSRKRQQISETLVSRGPPSVMYPHLLHLFIIISK